MVLSVQSKDDLFVIVTQKESECLVTVKKIDRHGNVKITSRKSVPDIKSALGLVDSLLGNTENVPA